jgi:predicted transcriptional regulator
LKLEISQELADGITESLGRTADYWSQQSQRANTDTLFDFYDQRRRKALDDLAAWSAATQGGEGP